VPSRLPYVFGPPAPPPGSPEGARQWLMDLGGAELTLAQPDGTFLISVGALGRSGEAVAQSSSTADLEKAFLEAVLQLHKRL
jgi:hypothetical protein